jgi:hypothetical protein
MSLISGNDEGVDLDCIDWDRDTLPISGPTTSTSDLPPASTVLPPQTAQVSAPSWDVPSPCALFMPTRSTNAGPQISPLIPPIEAMPPNYPVGSLSSPIGSPVCSPVGSPAHSLASVLLAGPTLPSDVVSAQPLPPPVASASVE